MFKQDRKYIGRIVILWLILLLGFVFTQYASARVAPPVHVKLKTDWVAKRGGPATDAIQVAQKGQVINVTIVISSGVDLDTADFDLLLPQGWEFVDGQRKWKGVLKKGGEVILKATVRTTSNDFGVIRGKVYLPGVSVEGLLDLRDPKITDRVPEVDVGSKVPTDVPTIRQDNFIPQLPEVKELRPEPPEVPADQELKQQQLDPEDVKLKFPGRNVRVVGRVGYIDDHGTYIGYSGARVILWDRDTIFDDEMVRGITDWNGYFDLTANTDSAGEDEPDLYIQVYALNPAIRRQK